MGNNELTVGELVEQLKDVDPNMSVITAGCDCDGYDCWVQIKSDHVYINRDKELEGE